MKVSELQGALLDYWVGRAGGEGVGTMPRDPQTWPVRIQDGICEKAAAISKEGKPCWWYEYAPSTDWAQAGPIIYREGITTTAPCHRYDVSHSQEWTANIGSGLSPHAPCHWRTGPTPLIAAMRCYVASKFGEEVPDQESP